MNLRPLIAFLFALSAASAEPDLQDRYRESFAKGDYPGMERVLKDWEASCPSDVEMLAAYGTYYYNRAKRGSRPSRAKFTARTEILLSPGSPSEDRKDQGAEPQFNRRDLSRAAKYWREAAGLSPRRLDIRFWLARAYQDLDLFEAQYQTLAETLQYADQHKGGLSWERGGSLPQRRSQLIPETLQDFQSHYFNQQRVESDQKAFRLARLAITFYPEHPAAYNSIAAYYSHKGDRELTLKYLLLAARRDGKDGRVLYNIGNVLRQFGREEEAGIYYKKVLALGGEGPDQDQARQRLAELEEKRRER